MRSPVNSGFPIHPASFSNNGQSNRNNLFLFLPLGPINVSLEFLRFSPAFLLPGVCLVYFSGSRSIMAVIYQPSFRGGDTMADPSATTSAF